MRQNGKVVYIKRKLKDLATSGRPVTGAKGVEQIFQERAALYAGWSDVTVENKDPHKAAEKIVEVLGL